MASRVAEIAALPFEDGVNYLTKGVTAITIRDDALCTGVRVTMDARIGTANVKLRLDVSFGDPVTPAPQKVVLPALRPGMAAITVLGYPIETVLAEKIVTAIDLGPANTRVRDYADIYSIVGAHDLALDSVRQAITATARHRSVDLALLSDTVGNIADARVRTWAAYQRATVEDAEDVDHEFVA